MTLNIDIGISDFELIRDALREREYVLMEKAKQKASYKQDFFANRRLRAELKDVYYEQFFPQGLYERTGMMPKKGWMFWRNEPRCKKCNFNFLDDGDRKEGDLCSRCYKVNNYAPKQ